jgi:hypothetical protein
MADALMKYETLADDQIKDIMAGRTPRPPDGWDDSTPSAGGGKPLASPLGGTVEGPVVRPAPAANQH